jgi:hypothetical protein
MWIIVLFMLAGCKVQPDPWSEPVFWDIEREPIDERQGVSYETSAFF